VRALTCSGHVRRRPAWRCSEDAGRRCAVAVLALELELIQRPGIMPQDGQPSPKSQPCPGHCTSVLITRQHGHRRCGIPGAGLGSRGGRSAGLWKTIAGLQGT
jgi:hypothetical protein